MGSVQNTRQVFENRIRQHRNEPDSVLISRALHNTDELIRQERTYVEQLHLTEEIGLHSLPSHLRDFLRDHDNLYRAAVRSRRWANITATTGEEIDLFSRVKVRVRNLQNIHSLNIIRETRSQAERTRMQKDPTFLKELHDCTDLLVDETYRVLHRYEHIQTLLPEETELENIGPDHNVNEFGCNIASPHTPKTPLDATDDNIKLDHTQRCCICLDTYTSHPAFKLSQCSHVIGKPCLATWLNSTAKNSNTCPFCRAELCTRRVRKISARTEALQTEQEELDRCLARALGLLEDVDRLANTIYGDGAHATLASWTGDAVVEINRRCFENGVMFGFTRNAGVGLGWRLVRVDWARGGVACVERLSMELGGFRIMDGVVAFAVWRFEWLG